MSEQCAICSSTIDLKRVKSGDYLCGKCRDPLARCHEVFGGKVTRIKDGLMGSD